ncbi:MAG: DUF3604 domain-containing protein, partial [Deltaproteobacteria bacterium]|nr:DUF3604 domain-containing protein [Deltaproteobacteria bacterium]
MTRSLSLVLAVSAVSLVALGCGNDSNDGGTGPDPLGRCAAFDELRQPFFGDTHVHTALSLDANLQGTRPGPEEAYAFAKGQTIGVQPYDEDGNPLRTATPGRPIDFVMLSDHAEFLGTIAVCNDPSSPAYDRSVDPPEVSCVDYRDASKVDQAFVGLNVLTARSPENVAYPELCGDDLGGDCIEAGKDVWAQVQEAAEAAYDRTDSCEFTSFVGYEWSAGPGTRNLHRNVMFRNEVVPDFPISYFDEPYVEDLWAGLREQCIDADTGCDALAIPHNSNLSQGTFFENAMKDGSPFDTEYAQLRNELEPVIEIFQHKGASECLPGQAISDELCGFEILPYANLLMTNLQIFGDADPRDFVRAAFGEGMKLEVELGVNPFQHGIISGTDTHIAAPGYDNEKTFLGHGGAGQPNRDSLPEGFPDIQYLNPGGPGGVWAEENSRDAIFQAMRRKETFGTSGPRIVPRVFGGWNLPSDLCDSPDLAQIGYAQGVPMGAELSDAPEGATPKFVVSAKQDMMSVPLQRVQIVKGWLDGDEYKVEVYDVAGDANNGASVDLGTCEPQGAGFSDLCTVWEDENFDPVQRAYYYVRVIENPTCRWSTQQCVDADYDCENPTTEMDEDCCNPTASLNVDFCDDVAAGLTGDEAACCRTDNPTSSINVVFCADVAERLP